MQKLIRIRTNLKMSETFDEAQAIVIDNGSGMCKAGLAGKDAPSI